MTTGRIFNIQHFSLHDGPGIRTTIFLKGCPLRCAWCHNPESLSRELEVLVTESRCIACGECIEACPMELPVPRTAHTAEMAELCLACGACAEACPCEARQVAGRDITVTEVVSEILKDRIFHEESGGGVTFSGGEPLWQAEFLFESLLACRAEGIHRAVDTSGLAPTEDLLAVAQETDLFLYDVKHLDDDRHREFTGVSNRQILANLEILAENHDRIWLRVPVIPGINDDRANLEATARLGARLDSVEQVCLLPYHPLGEDKARRLGLSGRLAETAAPDPEHMRGLAEWVEAAGIATSIGG